MAGSPNTAPLCQPHESISAPPKARPIRRSTSNPTSNQTLLILNCSCTSSSLFVFLQFRQSFLCLCRLTGLCARAEHLSRRSYWRSLSLPTLPHCHACTSTVPAYCVGISCPLRTVTPCCALASLIRSRLGMKR